MIPLLTCQQRADPGLHCVVLSEIGVELATLSPFAHLEVYHHHHHYLYHHHDHYRHHHHSDVPHLPALGLTVLPSGVQDVVVQDSDEGIAAGLVTALRLCDAVLA